MGIQGPIARSTLADANAVRDWRIYADFAQVLISIARPLYGQEEIGVDLDNTIYALDSTTIDLCLSLFPWARFRKRKAAIKLHTLIDVHGPIPVFVHITDGSIHDVNVLDLLVPEPGAYYLMYRGYIGFARLHEMHLQHALFVTRSKANLQFRRVYSHSADIHQGIRWDQTIRLTGPKTSHLYPTHLRRIHFYDAEYRRHLHFLTNDFSQPATTIAKLYKCRWSVELLFKWIKQHLRSRLSAGCRRTP
jgi:hypothetical protein